MSYDDDDDDYFFDSESERDPIEAFAPDDDVSALSEPRAPRRTRSRPRMTAVAGGSGGGEEHPPDSGGVGGDRNLVTAVGVGVALVAIGLLCFKLGGLATTALACVVAYLASGKATIYHKQRRV